MTKEVPRTSVLRDAELIAYLRLQGLDKDIAAADRIEALVKEKDQEYKNNIVRMAGQAKDFMEEISTLKARIEALSISNATLIAERDQWIAHAKNAIWSDSEQLRLAEAKLAENEVRLGKAVEALVPLCVIADAYDANELDDEARKFWGKNLEHENHTPLDEIEIFAGRGGKRLLTLADAMKARAALARVKSKEGFSDEKGVV